ncbi:MAG: DUF3558 family protein [Catenulispora sp.]|nr:DUF3558 family protein [Catenulispora sp.]
MRGRRFALLASAVFLVISATACSESGAVSGDSAPTRAGGSSQSPATDLSSSSSSPTADPDPVAGADPCTLVTRAEAQKLVGTAVDDAVRAGQETDSPSCTYTGPTSGPTAQVEVHTGPGAKKYYDLERDGLSHAMQAAPGIGDEAWTDKDDLSIFVRKGDAWFVIHIVVLDEPDKFIPRLRDAAKVAVTRA